MKFLKVIGIGAVIILGISLIIAMPFVLDKWLYSTHIYDSHLTSAEWSSFNGSYIGAVMGGIVTLIGIWITIKFQQTQAGKDRQFQIDQVNKERDFQREQASEDRRLSIAPYLKYNLYEEEKPYIKEEYDMNLHCIIDNNYTGNINCIMRFKNIGVGPVLDLKICNVFFNDERMDYLQDSLTNPSCDIVEKDSECFMLIALSLRLDRKKAELSEKSPLYNDVYRNGTLSFKVKYNDLMGHKYEQDIKVFMMTSFTFDEGENLWRRCSLPAFTVKKMEIGKINIVSKRK